MREGVAVVVPWVRDQQRDLFTRSWSLNGHAPDWLVLQHDAHREGSGATKNKGIALAIDKGAEVVLVLDDDCFPAHGEPQSLHELAERHLAALEPRPVEMYQRVTEPASRGTPYAERHILMPVAASMGFWTEIGDYCAVRQLAHESGPMQHHQVAVHGRYFSLCGMNLAFRPRDWMPWCRFIEVPRFDDIWMGWLWQREAYRRGACFNLAGPKVRHARQSNVWKNLRDEVDHLEASETLWRRIALSPLGEYEELTSLLPVPATLAEAVEKC